MQERSQHHFDIEAECGTRAEIFAAQNLADRVSAMLADLIRSLYRIEALPRDRRPLCVSAAVTVTVYVTACRARVRRRPPCQ